MNVAVDRCIALLEFSLNAECATNRFDLRCPASRKRRLCYLCSVFILSRKYDDTERSQLIKAVYFNLDFPCASSVLRPVEIGVRGGSLSSSSVSYPLSGFAIRLACHWSESCIVDRGERPPVRRGSHRRMRRTAVSMQSRNAFSRCWHPPVAAPAAQQSETSCQPIHLSIKGAKAARCGVCSSNAAE